MWVVAFANQHSALQSVAFLQQQKSIRVEQLLANIQSTKSQF